MSGLVVLSMWVTGCGEIPYFPGTGPPPRTPTASVRPAPAVTAAAPASAVGGGSAAPSAAPNPSPTSGAGLALPLTTPSASPGLPVAEGLAAVATLLPRPSRGGPGPSATPAPAGAHQGAASPREAVRRAYEAAVAGDDRDLEAVTDPELRDGPTRLRVFELLGRSGRRLTLHDMTYLVERDDGTRATVQVTGRVGNLPIFGERQIDEHEAVRKVDGSWYVSAPGENRPG